MTMDYDADKTDQILQKLQEAVESGHLKDAKQLLQHADASGRLKSDSGIFAGLKAAVGEKPALAIVKSIALQACPCCTGGREKCDECQGKGFVDDVRVCRVCAGLGLQRCPFCNGTCLAGYDFVPRGLRPTVLVMRLKFAEEQLKSLAKGTDQATMNVREMVKRIVSVDRCRGILANAVEQARLNEIGASSGLKMYSTASKTKIQRMSRSLNDKAEALIEKLFHALAEKFVRKAQAKGTDNRHRVLHAHRAKVFAELGARQYFGNTSLRTPAALQRH